MMTRYTPGMGMRWVLLAICLLAWIGVPDTAQAAAASCSNACSDNAALGTPLCQIGSAGTPTGMCILTNIVGTIRVTMMDASEQFFKAIVNSGISEIFRAALTLYIGILGLFYIVGMAQMQPYDMVTRLIKVIIIAMVVGPGGWAFFNQYVGGLFREGLDELMSEVSGLMVTTVSSLMTGSAIDLGAMRVSNYSMGENNPFLPLDLLVGQILKPGTFAILTAAKNDGGAGWGLAYIGVFAFGLLYLVGAIAKAMWVYLLSLLTTSFLIGLAPIFIIFMLFQRTKSMFDNWLKALISFSLQPLFLFLFLALFASIMSTAMDGLMKAPACLVTNYTGQEQAGTYSRWVFVPKDGSGCAQPSIVCEARESGYVAVGAGTANQTYCDQLNKDVSDMFPELLIFFLLGYICWHFADFVVSLAQLIAGSFAINFASETKGFLHGAGSTLQSYFTNTIKGPMQNAFDAAGGGGGGGGSVNRRNPS